MLSFDWTSVILIVQRPRRGWNAYKKYYWYIETIKISFSGKSTKKFDNPYFVGFLSRTRLRSKNLCIKLHCALTNNANNLRHNCTSLPDCMYLHEPQNFSACGIQHTKPNCVDSLHMTPRTLISLLGKSHTRYGPDLFGSVSLVNKFSAVNHSATP